MLGNCRSGGSLRTALAAAVAVAASSPHALPPLAGHAAAAAALGDGALCTPEAAAYASLASAQTGGPGPQPMMAAGGSARVPLGRRF